MLTGMPTFAKTTGNICFLTEEMTWPIESIHDEWRVRRDARVRSLGVSRACLPRLPWEEVLYGPSPKPLPGYPLTTQVPEHRLDEAKRVRTAILKLLHGYEGMTFEAMASVVLANLDTLKDMDECVDLDVHFLQHHAPQIAERTVHAEVLNLFPKAEQKTPMSSMQATVNGLEEVRAGPFAIALGDTMANTLRSVQSMVEGIRDGRAPSQSLAMSMKGLSREVLQRCEIFLAVENELAGTHPSQPAILYGRRALDLKWARFFGADD